MIKTAPIFAAIIISGLCLMCGCSRHGIDEPGITTDELRKSVFFLASDSLKGRYPGTAEDIVLSRFLADELSASGLELLFDHGLQSFEVIASRKAGAHNSLEIPGCPAVISVDYTPFSFSESATLQAEVVFAGFGFNFTSDTLTWNDYDNLDVKGKWVLLLRGDPEPDNVHSPFMRDGDDRNKAIEAKDQGAAGVLLVSGPAWDKNDELSNLEDKKGTVGIPVFHVKRKVADCLLDSSGRTVAQLESFIIEERKAMSFSTGISISGTSEIVEQKVPTFNVAALLEGQDPALKSQFVVVGAHKDHLGMGGPGTGTRQPDQLGVHNGADDNASGVAALLEIAENLSWHRDSIRRSVLFVAFGAEEMGLVGSAYFIENLPVDLHDIKTMVNLDMVGRLNKDSTLTIGGTGTAEGGESLLKSMVKDQGLNLTFSPEGYGPSDHASFYRKDIPVFFLTTGVHLDYHTMYDDADSLNYPGLQRVSEFASGLVRELANRDEPLTFREAGSKEGTQQYGRRGRGPTLGIMPDVTGLETRGLRADLVLPGRPAVKAGMLKGDIIVAINGKEVRNIYDYTYRLGELKYGQTINVEILRNDERKIIIIQL